MKHCRQIYHALKGRLTVDSWYNAGRDQKHVNSYVRKRKKKQTNETNKKKLAHHNINKAKNNIQGFDHTNNSAEEEKMLSYLPETNLFCFIWSYELIKSDILFLHGQDQTYSSSEVQMYTLPRVCHCR